MGYVTSEKQAPSALDLLGSIAKAIGVERRQANNKPGVSKALKDMLTKVVGDFNKLTTNKKHRIDTGRKSLLYNLLLVDLTTRCLPTEMFVGIGIVQLNLSESLCSALRLRAPEAVGGILHQHYDSFPHEISGNASLCHFLVGNFTDGLLQAYHWNCSSLISGCLELLLVAILQNLLGSLCFGKSCQQVGNRACYGLHGWCRTF